MNADFRKAPLPPLALAQPPSQPVRAAQITGDQLGVRLEEQEPRPVEKLHQGPGRGNAPFGKQDQPALLLQKIRHVPHGIRRRRVDRKGAPVPHDQLVNPVLVRHPARHHELPVVVQYRAQQQPVDPRHVIGNQQHRPRCVQRLDIVGAEPEQDPHRQPRQRLNDREKDPKQTLNDLLRHRPRVNDARRPSQPSGRSILSIRAGGASSCPMAATNPPPT